VSRPPCAHFAQDRSALVDDALGLGRRERLLAHLVHCAACRDDVAELRRVREALRGGPPAEAPEELAERLISIAGADARTPLPTPAKRPRRRSLPARRRTLRVRAGAAIALAAAVAGAAVAGYVAAPPLGGSLVADPTSEAQAAFSSTLAQMPLANDALGAVMAAAPRDLGRPVAAAGPVQAVLGHRALTETEARATLARAASSADAVAYSGVQTFWSRSEGRVLQASVQVRALPGQGIQAQVLDRSGRPVSGGYTPATAAARMVDDKLLKLLGSSYVLSGWAEAEVAGRSATVVEARRSGRLAARWWVDDASGIVLGRQTFDDVEGEVMSVRFTDVQISRSSALLEHLAAPGVTPATDTVLTLSNAPDLVSRGWVCRGILADLSLVRLGSDGAADPQTLHLVYTDGLATLSVLEQRGRLATAPGGASWDTGLRAYTREGPSRLATWQSGDTVFTVATDGSSALLARAVSSLPHDPVPERTTMGRIREGWAKLLADMKG
jgi:hypothetical protein